jgi:hypothetical protein
MQGLPLKAPEHFDYGFTRSLWQGQAPSVNRVANQRMTAPGKMHTNLVGSPCFQRHTDIGKGPESLQSC